MNDIAIQVENVGKLYRIGSAVDHNKTFREALTDMVAEPFRRIRNAFSPAVTNNINQADYIWALKNVTFDVKRGEVVGIIGRNGAGKSTLLKILSRITEPTEGRVRVRGRIGSLLEVGSGFHSELTGEENIYLSGTILGMHSNEISRKFDEIVNFAEIGKYLHTPVKYYSSGMYMRLAFAVAAHLDTEILLVDEVLAVGDAAFQKKCLGKMGDVSKAGRTVLFVSHQMGAIAQNCTYGLMLDYGQIVTRGDPSSVISHYLSSSLSKDQNRYVRTALDVSRKNIFVVAVKTVNLCGEDTTEFSHNEPIVVNITYQSKKVPPDGLLGATVKDNLGRRIFVTQTKLPDTVDAPMGLRTFLAVVRIPGNVLTPGVYSFRIGLHIPNITILDLVDDVCRFTVTDVGSDFSIYREGEYGCVFVTCDWSVKELSQ